MTKSQNTKNEQQKDLCITSEQLTEQWKKGELPEGHYYIKDGENMIAEYLGGYFYNDGVPMTSFYGGVDSVLEKVPTFDEWQASEKYNKYLEEKIKIYERKDKQATETSIAYNELAEENDKLKTENKWYSEQLNEALKEILQLKEIIEKDKKVFAESRIYPTHLISEDFPVKYDIDRLKELLKECQNILEEQNFYRNTPIETDMIYRTRCLKKQELLTKIDEVLK